MYKGKIYANVPEAKEGSREHSKVVEVAENFADATKLFGSEQNCMDILNQAYKVKIQNDIRREARTSLGLSKTSGAGKKGKGIARV